MLNLSESVDAFKRRHAKAGQKVLRNAVIMVAVAGLAACGGSKDKKPGQALASVNGEEVTVTQLNDELQRANIQSAQQEAASKQLLESLIDRQLLVSEATKEKYDRDPKVVQSIERAKALIIAQAYMQKRIGNPTKPTKEEIAAYFNENPMFFAERKQLDMRQLVLATRDIGDELKAVIDGAKTLDEVAAWMDAHKIAYSRGQASRTTADLPRDLSKRLLTMPKGQLFLVKEGERSLLVTIADIKDSPQTLESAENAIAQFLFNKKSKDAADAEIKRLRADAKIEYLNKQMGPAASASAAASAPAAAPAAGAAQSSADANARGVAGLK